MSAARLCFLTIFVVGAGCSGRAAGSDDPARENVVIDIDKLMTRAAAPTGDVVVPSAMSEPIPVRSGGALAFVVFEYAWFMREGRPHVSGPYERYMLDSMLNLVGQEPMDDGAKDLGPVTGPKASDTPPELEPRYRRALAELLPIFARGGELTGTLHGARDDVCAFYRRRISDAHWPYYRKLGGEWLQWLGGC